MQTLETRAKLCSKIISCGRVCSEEIRKECTDYKPFAKTYEPVRRGYLAYTIELIRK